MKNVPTFNHICIYEFRADLHFVKTVRTNNAPPQAGGRREQLLPRYYDQQGPRKDKKNTNNAIFRVKKTMDSSRNPQIAPKSLMIFKSTYELVDFQTDARRPPACGGGVYIVSPVYIFCLHICWWNLIYHFQVLIYLVADLKSLMIFKSTYELVDFQTDVTRTGDTWMNGCSSLLTIACGFFVVIFCLCRLLVIAHIYKLDPCPDDGWYNMDIIVTNLYMYSEL
jgi:hypothetical protein